MNQHLQDILNIFQEDKKLDSEQKEAISDLLKIVDRELEITTFKLDRTEKVKRTTAILLEETIEELEQKRKAVEDSHEALQQSMDELKAAQAQLIQSEKMASLGELTAGIAHEIQNPLNFVNNFSEVSIDLLDELDGELENGELEEVRAIKDDLKSNLGKITTHGKRASGIVRGMLEHSRTSSGKKTPTDLNALADEYLRLAFHGFKAKDRSFNADFKINLDKSLPEINVVPQDIGRVLLNLINNAFYAVTEKAKQSDREYKPEVIVSTYYSPLERGKGGVEIRIKDNGSGIPPAIEKKIFQPFFTTKPTGQGTGLGLSLSYDIITKGHGGELKVRTKENMGAEFRIKIPTNS